MKQWFTKNHIQITRPKSHRKFMENRRPKNIANHNELYQENASSLMNGDIICKLIDFMSKRCAAVI